MQKVIRIVALVAAVGFFVALLIFNANQPKPSPHEPWNANMTLGDFETAEHFYVDYTDIMCPYCDKFANAMAAHMDEFKRDYIEDKKIFFEIRMTDMIYIYHQTENSKISAQAAYCAADQSQFWAYYDAILARLTADYFDKGIGVDKSAPKIPELGNEYFIKAAEEIDFDQARFASCVENEEMLETVNKNTTRASKIAQSGVPYFVFDSYTANGFMGEWNTDKDWVQAKLLLDAGL